jgi:beta-glucosidase-like glycosyl hydrolase
VPSTTALAATRDETRVAAVGRLLAAEARRAGVDIPLAPTVNLHRTPFGGRELYLARFEEILRDGASWSVMAACNAINGSTTTESPTLAEILQQEWGYDGVVISDWGAARSLAAVAAALDLVMPGPNGPWGAAPLAPGAGCRRGTWRPCCARPRRPASCWPVMHRRSADRTDRCIR